MTTVSMTSAAIRVDHITMTSSHAFDEVRRRLEEIVPTLDTTIIKELADGNAQSVKRYEDKGPALSIFLQRDHGALLQIVGHPRKAIQYEIGNPLTASKMTRHHLSAGLYAPLRVVLYENDEGHAVFEYDKPSSLFGQFGDDRVTEVGRGLDVALESALRQAAS